VTDDMVEKIAAAVLYEGYLLYPYRRSAVKNQRRFNFGVLAPRAYCDAQPPHSENAVMQTECLVADADDSTINIKIRFLHLIELSKGEGQDCFHQAVEREVCAPQLLISRIVQAPYSLRFHCGANLKDDVAVDRKSEDGVEWACRQEEITGRVEIGAELIESGLHRVRVQIVNTKELSGSSVMSRDQALMHSMVSTHTILTVHPGDFVSLLDPPGKYRDAAAGCNNTGTWPVLVGVEGASNRMLSSPIILYDYPQIAPESEGDLFDGTEIDEILLLRILTLTDDEKREMRAGDERARLILERAESLGPEQLARLHGTLRNLRSLDG
jgi:hypothetical protein